MKIKLAILHNDATYLKRLATVVELNYKEKLEFYAFTDYNIAISALSNEKIDVLLADDAFKIDLQQIPSKCGFAHFVDSPEIEMLNGCQAICRFQRAELIYKQILGLFSEVLGQKSVRNIYSGGTKIMVFSSPCGGTGTSTLAAACTLHFATAGKRSLYLNFECFGMADSYFSGGGSSDLSDVIYAVKSGKSNLSVKLESCVKQSNQGVYFFSGAKMALDVKELTTQEKIKIVSELTNFGNYDYIIIDMDFDLNQETLALFQLAHALVWVSDGIGVSNLKIMRAYEALKVLGADASPALAERVCVIQNKYNDALGDNWHYSDIRSSGTTPKIKHRMDEQITISLAQSKAFDIVLM